jgi:two-component system, sensor histidine kinase and response regulator
MQYENQLMDNDTSDYKQKILVIEDEQSLRKDIIEMLTFEGFDVAEAENGRAGVDVARQYLPDLIICDIMMPELNGYEVLAALQQYTNTKTIPFIFLTARTDKQDRRKGMDEGADDFLTKPFNVEDLLNTIRVRMEKHEQIMAKGSQRVSSSIIMSMPHELRTPLTVILGFSDILIMDYATMEPSRTLEMAEHINKAALRLYNLVENYLVFAQIEIAANDEEFIETLHKGKTTQAHLFIQAQVTDKAHQHNRADDLQVDIAEIEHIQMREDLLKKLVEELVDNAFKFSTPGSPVQVTVKPEGQQWVLTVSDKGRGLTPKQITRIGAYMQFDRKFHEQQGSGLGLVIAQRITQLHSGQFAIDSEPNDHTIITVKLPM